MVEFNRIKIGDTVQLKPAIVIDINENNQRAALEIPGGFRVWVHESSIAEHIPAPEVFCVGDIVVVPGLDWICEGEIIALNANAAWCKVMRDSVPCYYTIPVKSLTRKMDSDDV